MLKRGGFISPSKLFYRPAGGWEGPFVTALPREAGFLGKRIDKKITKM
jgi:hypothetical protein